MPLMKYHYETIFLAYIILIPHKIIKQKQPQRTMLGALHVIPELELWYQTVRGKLLLLKHVVVFMENDAIFDLFFSFFSLDM